MAADEKQFTALANTVAWLEDELRETRAGATKLAQTQEQTQAQLWDLTNALHRFENVLSALQPQLAVIPRIDSQLSPLRDGITAVQQQGMGTAARLGELSRQIEAEVERQRLATAELLKRVENVERQTQAMAGQLEALEDMDRRLGDLVAQVRLRAEETSRHVEDVQGRVGRAVESASRTEAEQARIGGELDNLHKQDGVLSERLGVYADLVKRIEVQISKVASEITIKQDVMERLDLSRVERQRLEERIASVEGQLEHFQDSDEEAIRQLSLIDGRQRGFQDRLNNLLNDLVAYRAQMLEQIQRIYQVQERMKRRQIEDIERDLREMRMQAFRTTEEHDTASWSRP